MTDRFFRRNGNVRTELEWIEEFGEDFEDRSDIEEVFQTGDGGFVSQDEIDSEGYRVCEDDGFWFRPSEECLTIVNEKTDEIKHYCPYCTEHGRFELNPGDELIYDRDIWREVRQGNNLVYLERV